MAKAYGTGGGESFSSRGGIFRISDFVTFGAHFSVKPRI